MPATHAVQEAHTPPHLTSATAVAWAGELNTTLCRSSPCLLSCYHIHRDCPPPLHETMFPSGLSFSLPLRCSPSPSLHLEWCRPSCPPRPSRRQVRVPRGRAIANDGHHRWAFDHYHRSQCPRMLPAPPSNQGTTVTERPRLQSFHIVARLRRLVWDASTIRAVRLCCCGCIVRNMPPPRVR
jgi:hypothetical protein